MRRYRAQGTSMLPALYPRDTLHVREVRPEDLVLGAMVAFPGRGVVVCHRIVGQQRRADGRWLLLRGDAQTRGEWVRARSIAFVVVEVEGRLGHWRAHEGRDRWLAGLALSERGSVRALRLGAAILMRRVAALRRFARGPTAK